MGPTVAPGNGSGRRAASRPLLVALTLACVVGDTAYARQNGLTDTVTMFQFQPPANPSTSGTISSAGVTDTGAGPGAGTPPPPVASASAVTAASGTGRGKAGTSKFATEVKPGTKPRKGRHHRTTVPPLPVGSFSPSLSPVAAKGSPSAAPTSKGVAPSAPSAPPAPPPTADPTQTFPTAAPASPWSPPTSPTSPVPIPFTTAPSGAGGPPSGSPSFDPPPPEPVMPTPAAPSATPTIIIRPIRPTKPSKTPIACRRLRQASIKSLCGAFYGLGYANCTAACTAKRHDDIVTQFNISGCHQDWVLKDIKANDNDGVMFYAQEFCSGSVDGKDKADRTEFEEKAGSAAGGAVAGGILVCLFNNRRSVWAWLTTVICAVATTVGVADRARAAKRRRYTEGGDVEAAAMSHARQPAPLGGGGGSPDDDGSSGPGHPHATQPFRHEYEDDDDDADSMPFTEDDAPFTPLEPPPPPPPSQSLSARARTPASAAGGGHACMDPGTRAAAPPTPVLPAPTPLDSETKDALEAASRLAFARLAFDTAENESMAAQVAIRVIAGAAADVAPISGAGGLSGRRPCFLVERCAGSKARFQVPVGKKTRMVAQKAIYLSYTGTSPGSLDARHRIHQTCLCSDGTWWCLEPTHLSQQRAASAKVAKHALPLAPHATLPLASPTNIRLCTTANATNAAAAPPGPPNDAPMAHLTQHRSTGGHFRLDNLLGIVGNGAAGGGGGGGSGSVGSIGGVGGVQRVAMSADVPGSNLVEPPGHSWASSAGGWISDATAPRVTCAECGASQAAHANFCDRCGANLTLGPPGVATELPIWPPIDMAMAASAASDASVSAAAAYMSHHGLFNLGDVDIIKEIDSVSDNSSSSSSPRYGDTLSPMTQPKPALTTPMGTEYQEMDRRWPSVVYGEDIKALNAYVKDANLSAPDVDEIRRARRRHKNRIYAKRSRGKRPSKHIEVKDEPRY